MVRPDASREPDQPTRTRRHLLQTGTAFRVAFAFDAVRFHQPVCEEWGGGTCCFSTCHPKTFRPHLSTGAMNPRQVRVGTRASRYLIFQTIHASPSALSFA